MDIAKNHSDLSRAEVVLALKDLVIKRITRTYEFKTPIHYVMRTHLLFQNQSTYSCPVVPGEFYEKEILVDFKAYDRNKTEGILIPSDENDALLIKYIFLKIIEDMDKSCDQNYRLVAKRAIYFQFTGQEKYLDPNCNMDIAGVLNEEFNGPIATGFFKSMWEDDKTMDDYLDMSLIEHIPAKYGRMYENLQNVTIKNISSQDTRNFILRFQKYFLQLILLKTPINSDDYSTLTLETDRFRSSLKKHFGLSEKLELQIDIRPLLPGQGKSTSHYMIKSPEGVQFGIRPSWKHILEPPPNYFSLREKTINPEYFNILHDPSSEECMKTLGLLKITQHPIKRIDILKKIVHPEEERSSLDIRAQIKENLISLYFRSPRKRKEALCNESHKLKISMGLARGSVFFFHYFLIFFMLCMILLCYHWLSEISVDPTLEIPSSFWTFAFFVVAQSIAVIFDYSRRNDAQRYFMRDNIIIILFLIVPIVFLLLAIVVLPILS